jgi:integral membrane sensor domain MASE1
MEAEKQSIMLKGIALSVVYCVVYIALRRYSFDQWFLPAGLRVGALLFFPYRYWPYLLAGDMAALLIVRVPMADRYSVQWAYFSPLLLAPLVAVPLHLFRKRFNTVTRIAYALPLIGLPAALWSTVCNNILNFFLDGPQSKINYIDFFRYAIGDYLGILMIALPSALIIEASRATQLPKKLLRVP